MMFKTVSLAFLFFNDFIDEYLSFYENHSINQQFLIFKTTVKRDKNGFYIKNWNLLPKIRWVRWIIIKKDKKDREFTLILEPSNEKLRCFLSQDNGKGIESVEKQSDLGKWLHNDIFQLKEDEPLTAKKLNELHLNAVRLYKTNKDNDIHIVFIWIDDDNLPDDYFE